MPSLPCMIGGDQSPAAEIGPVDQFASLVLLRGLAQVVELVSYLHVHTPKMSAGMLHRRTNTPFGAPVPAWLIEPAHRA